MNVVQFVSLSGGKAASRRPPATPHAPLPPFDAGDRYGSVATAPPPELQVPAGPDVHFMRADFNGVNLNAGRWGGNPPMLIGANSTPQTMLMTPMLPMYPAKWQDACLTEHAERGYSHFVVAATGWNMAANGFSFTPAQFVAWCQYVQSWGFYVVYWADVTNPDPFLAPAVAARCIDFHIVGEEVNSKMDAPSYEALLDYALANNGGIPTAAHFTSDYPIGFPLDTYLTNWGSKYNGRVHLCWQADQAQSAGLQAAMLYYARQRVALGTIGGDGVPAPDCRVYAFETMATAQLYGQCTEEYGCLRSLELLWAPATAPVPAMSGFGNGCRLPNGNPL
jgi:hypothetical protein